MVWAAEENREGLGSELMETDTLSNESPQNRLGALCSTTAQILMGSKKGGLSAPAEEKSEKLTE